MHDRSRSLLLHVGGIVALLAGALLLQYLVDTLLVESIVSAGGTPGWLPTFGTAGQTLTVYLLATELVTQLLVPLSMAYVAYRYGRVSATAATGGEPGDRQNAAESTR